MTSTRFPQVDIFRRTVEIHAEVRDAPPLHAGRYTLDVFKILVVYRIDETHITWQFVHISVNGTWLDGALAGKTGLRRYGRSSVDRIPDWLQEFINDNNPGK